MKLILLLLVLVGLVCAASNETACVIYETTGLITWEELVVRIQESDVLQPPEYVINHNLTECLHLNNDTNAVFVIKNITRFTEVNFKNPYYNLLMKW